jgi:chromate transporter
LQYENQIASAPNHSAPDARTMFLSFLGVGLSGFGGVLPFARRMLVERKAWMTEADFTETLALCQSLPGPNIVNLSVVVGSRYAGVKGALACLTGLVAAPVAIVIGLAMLNDRFGAIGRAPDMLLALGAAAAGLVAATVAKIARPVLAARPWTAAPVIVVVFCGVGLFRLPLPTVLAVAAPLSLALVWRSAR